jgi:4-amino-4-deoxy-L-arabinose transferase-like glycosyltransferase
MLRNALGVLIGIAIVTILTAYGGVGVNLLLAIRRSEVPHDSVLLYLILICYFLGVALLLLMAALFTLAEFRDWKIKHQKVLIYPTLVLLLVLAVIHLAVFFGIGSVGDQEAKNLFVDGAAPYAVLILVAVGLFVLLHRNARVA